MNMQLLESILTAYGATGCEGRVREVIKSALEGYVDSMEVDVMGNLIATRRGDGTGKRIMLSSHMDHIGLVVIDADKHGFLRVCAVGGIHADNMVSQHVAFENGVEGVVLAQGGVKGDVKVEDLCIDIGAGDREDALARVSIGDVCVMKPRVTKLGDNRLASPAMDDRIACYAQVEAVRALPKDLKNDVIAVFSVQEEVGLRGATTAAYAVHPDMGIAVDVTATGDTPKAKPQLPVKLGGGAAVKIMDRSLICTPAVVDWMLDAAKENDIPVQREVLPFGGTDGGAIQKTGSGVPTGVISIPCRYIHSAAETVDLRDVDAATKLIVACVTR